MTTVTCPWCGEEHQTLESLPEGPIPIENIDILEEKFDDVSPVRHEVMEAESGFQHVVKGVVLVKGQSVSLGSYLSEVGGWILEFKRTTDTDPQRISDAVARKYASVRAGGFNCVREWEQNGCPEVKMDETISVSKDMDEDSAVDITEEVEDLFG